MHFYYIDEAGCTGRDLKNPEQPIFVLGGISVRDEGWNKSQQRIAEIINNYFNGSPPPAFELHSEQLLSPDGDGPFASHPREKRNKLAKDILNLLLERKHSVYYYAIDKARLSSTPCTVSLCYDLKIPYLLAYDYIITHINWLIKNKLGTSARGMLIIDKKEEFSNEIEIITNDRRYKVAPSHRIKWIVEFSYPLDSAKNPMIQFSDLIVFCTKKFLEVEMGYRNSYTDEAKQFYAKCYSLIADRIERKQLAERQGRNMSILNEYLKLIQATPSIRWKRKYHL